MLVLLAFGTPAAAQSLSKGEVVFTGTNWRVMRTKDGMTDKVTCTGIWRDEYRVQLNAEAFYINRKGQGGVDAYHVRIDDAPAKEMVLATRTERDISAIMLKNIANWCAPSVFVSRAFRSCNPRSSFTLILPTSPRRTPQSAGQCK